MTPDAFRLQITVELDPECPELPLTRLTMVTDDMVELRGEINDGDSSEMREPAAETWDENMCMPFG